jgi:hypothetical protein
MSSSYSNLKFELIGTGEALGSWGNLTNINIGTAIEQAIVGMATLTSADFTANVATLTLTNTSAAQNARALCLNIAAGAVSAAGTINVPAIQKPYIIINGSSFTVTVKVSGLTGVAVPSGRRTVVYNNGTDVGDQITALSSLYIAGALTLGAPLPILQGGTGSSTLAGASIPTYTSTATLTNKRITPRTNPQVTITSPWAWSSDSFDQQSFSALANALTINIDTGTPTDGQKTIFRFRDDGTSRGLTWTSGVKGFRAVGVSLPVGTVPSKTLYVGCIYNGYDARWDVVSVAQEV